MYNSRKRCLARNAEEIQAVFTTTLQLLEQYIATSQYNNPQEVTELLSNQLLTLAKELPATTLSLQEQLKQQFYQWLSNKEINPNNCSEKLKHTLHQLNEVLERNNERIQRDTELSNSIFSNEEERDRSLENKCYYTNVEQSRGKAFEQYNEYHITNSQIVQDITDNPQKNFYQEQAYLASLIQSRKETADKILGNIQEVIRFKTWWSNYNVATVINHYNSCYRVFVVIYEPAYKEKSEVLETFVIDNGYDKNSLESVKIKTQQLRNELNGENPILAIHPWANGFTSFSDIVKEPYVRKVDLPFTINHRSVIDSIGIADFVIDGISYTREPNKYLKSLDIVKINMNEPPVTFYHVGVYLGNNRVCHYSKEKNGIRIDSWEDFLEGGEKWFRDEICGLWNSCPNCLYGYHPIIPFKNFRRVAEQIAWAEDFNFRGGEYNLANRNCEHFANTVVYGINYSEQAKNSSLINLGYSNKNNGKGSTVKLTKEIKESSEKLGWKCNDLSREIERQYLQEVPPKKDCRIM